MVLTSLISSIKEVSEKATSKERWHPIQHKQILQHLDHAYCCIYTIFIQSWHKHASIKDAVRSASKTLNFNISVQFKMVSKCSGKPIHAPPQTSGISPTLLLKPFPCWSDWQWACLVLSTFKADRQPLPFFTPLSSRWSWCDVFGFVPEGQAPQFH